MSETYFPRFTLLLSHGNVFVEYFIDNDWVRKICLCYFVKLLLIKSSVNCLSTVLQFYVFLNVFVPECDFADYNVAQQFGKLLSALSSVCSTFRAGLIKNIFYVCNTWKRYDMFVLIFFPPHSFFFFLDMCVYLERCT